jgi:hypothetical protein
VDVGAAARGEVPGAHGNAPAALGRRGISETEAAVGVARGCTLSLLDLCSHTNKDWRWETTTRVETREVLPAGAQSTAAGA